MDKVLKGVLLWVTMIVTVAVAISIDCLFENLYVGSLSVLAVVVLITLCYKNINSDEFMELTLSNYFNKKL